jgi:hypothetical protein
LATELFVESECNDCRVVTNILYDTEPYILLACSTTQDLCTQSGYNRYRYTYSMRMKYLEGRYFAEISGLKCISVYGCNDCKLIDVDSEYSTAMNIQRTEFETLKYLLDLHVKKMLGSYQRWMLDSRNFAQ